MYPCDPLHATTKDLLAHLKSPDKDPRTPIPGFDSRAMEICGREQPRPIQRQIPNEGHYDTFPPETRNKECLPAPERAVPGRDRVRRRRPVACYGKPSLVHILLEREKEPPAG